MAITINGTGTITGISAGGLPDGSVTAADLATTLDLSSNTVTLPSGTGGQILQVARHGPIDSTNTNSATTHNSSTYSQVQDGSFTFTPTAADSTLYIMADIMAFGDIDSDSHGTVAGQIKFTSTVSSTETTRYETAVVVIDRAGQSRSKGTTFITSFDVSSTNEITFKTYLRRTEGSRNLNCGQGKGNHWLVMEVAA